ncbi:MAG: 5'-3' exonuclease [Steroidobacteraceae bacterium]
MIHLVDASVYVFRAYYALPPEMVDRDGHPANAVFGFARMLCDLLERTRPAYMAVAFDHSLTRSFRSRIYPPYKANRAPAPPGLALQFARCFELCELLGIAAIGSPDYEADDIIGSLAWRMREEGVRATFITRDKDLAQLVREGDALWDYGSRDPLSYSGVARRFGVAPERFADYLALTGDAVDNIPGVPGIGPKTAAALMSEFATLEELYEGLDRIQGLSLRGAAAVRARLIEHREAAYLARRLTVIACDMPLALSRDMLRRRAPDGAALEGFFDRQGFGPLLRRQADRLAV